MNRTVFPWLAGAVALALAMSVLIYGQSGSTPESDLLAAPPVQNTEVQLRTPSSPMDVPTSFSGESPPGDTDDTGGAHVAPVRNVTTPAVDTRAAEVAAEHIAPQAPATLTDDEILDRLRATYEALDALRARFTQQIGGQVTEGTVILSGDRYRIELPGQVLVSDGVTAWAFSEADNQVLVNDHIDDVSAFSPNAFFSRYPDEFNVRRAGSETIRGARHDVLHLTPRQASAYVTEVTLYVRSSDSIPTRVRILDGQGSALLFELRDIEVNPRLSPDTFRLRIPSGAEVIDLRG